MRTPRVNSVAARLRFQCSTAPETESRLSTSAIGSGFSATRSSLRCILPISGVAKQMLAVELGYIDNYVTWFKQRGVNRMAAVGGFGTRLYPILIERYGDFIVPAEHEPLHGAIILAQQNFGSQ